MQPGLVEDVGVHLFALLELCLPLLPQHPAAFGFEYKLGVRGLKQLFGILPGFGSNPGFGVDG